MKQPTPIYQFNFSNVPYSDNVPPAPGETIKESGCGIVSSTMMLNAFGIKVTVQELAKLSMDHHYRVESGTSWALFPFIAKTYDLQMTQTDDMATVEKALQNGSLVICSMGPGTFTKGGHFILAYDYAGGMLYFCDPASALRTGRAYSPELVQKEHKEYFIFSKKITPAKTTPQEAVTFAKGKILTDDAKWLKKAMVEPETYQLLANFKNYVEKGGK
ncbi:MAG: C39 family peptidase [Bacillota bacterium]|nr:C39 family peptidase [Bacillota bacterium]